ncbi:MAG: polysaccharide deacetylase family protein [Treponema sp.]|nr:polysaccharide deacetylase family protein [Treponema sp.]
MRNCKIIGFLILFNLIVLNLFGINFQDINLSNDDKLIYRANFENQHSVFISQLSDMSIKQLTAYPEKLYMVSGGRTIIALSRFGAASIPAEGGLPSPLRGYPSFTEGSLPLGGRLQDTAVSSDGRWCIFIEPVSPGYGNLILIELSSGARRVISERIENPASYFPAKWSPDSRFFVYSKSGRLFYFPIFHNISALADERFRTIGHGNINSVLWGHQGDFYYYTGNTLYRIINPELFTRTMYGDFLSIGNVATVLPMEFNPGFDNFWIAPDSSAILINKSGKGFFYFLLGENKNNITALPHVIIPDGAENFNVHWPSGGALTVIYSLNNETKVWRFETGTSSITTAELQNVPLSAIGSLSPDGTKAIFWGERGLELWDYNKWELTGKLSETAVISCVWASDGRIIAGNSRFIEEINILNLSSPRKIICLSGADEIGFEDRAQTGFTREPVRILARLGNLWFATDGEKPWIGESQIRLRPVSFSSERFRVFLEPQASGPFINIPMLRNLQSFGTISPFSKHKENNVFARQQQKRIALCFDLYDDDTGLTKVLSALRRYNIKATFFLNGEFIRRNPLSARAITLAGHEAASLFYAPIDLSDSRYRITQTFITQGLSRNEDEFNRATGRELSGLWHPPYYRSSALINAAAAAAGYVTVSASIDPGDWLSREDTLRLNMRQIPPSEMINQIMERLETNAIVPVRLGLLAGGRDEYLFQHIEVLLDALIRSGCEIVPVSAVIRR